jgi:hypothetical protein
LSGHLSFGVVRHQNKYLTVSAVSTLAANQSNQSVFDYQAANIGGAVAFAVKF